MNGKGKGKAIAVTIEAPRYKESWHMKMVRLSAN